MRPPASQCALLSRALYRAWGRVGLSAFAPNGAALAMILIGLSAGGCSFPSLGNGPFARITDKDVTGSLRQPDPVPAPTEADLAFARTAASDVLTKGDKDSSQPWQNPETGARGSVTRAGAGLCLRRWTHLPRFPRKLRQRQDRELAAGFGLPQRQRPLGNPYAEALAAELINGGCIPVAKIQLAPQMKPKAGRPPLVYDLTFPEGDVTDARPL